MEPAAPPFVCIAAKVRARYATGFFAVKMVRKAAKPKYEQLVHSFNVGDDPWNKDAS